MACRDAADAAFHRYECSVNETIAGFGCSQVARLAYRMVASRPLQFFLDHKHSLDAASKVRCAIELIQLESIQVKP